MATVVEVGGVGGRGRGGLSSASGMGSSRMGLGSFSASISSVKVIHWRQMGIYLVSPSSKWKSRWRPDTQNPFASLLLHNATHSYTRTDNRAVAC